MNYPKCFENQEQFDEWRALDLRMDPRNHNLPCLDCTPSYATAMRLEGRCEHPEVKFYRYMNAYRGEAGDPRGRNSKIFDPVKWEACDV